MNYVLESEKCTDQKIRAEIKSYRALMHIQIVLLCKI